MPLYECRCERCGVTFEVLVRASEAGFKTRACPQCGRRARRVISAASFSFAGAGSGEPASGGSKSPRSDVTRLSVPPFARFCWMDDRSAARFAAYKQGRGAEYDDVVGAREERRKQRGLPPEAPAGGGSHVHGRLRKRANDGTAAAHADHAHGRGGAPRSDTVRADPPTHAGESSGARAHDAGAARHGPRPHAH